MLVEEAGIPGILVLTPERYEDGRGFFSETYSRDGFLRAGIDLEFVQDNHSFNSTAGTIRGLHFQAPPHAQDKLVRVSRGSALDVAVDLRLGSPTYGQWTSVELSARRWNQLFIPEGFAHGFCTLEPDTHVLYKVSRPYAPASEGGLAWNDPELAIEWPSMDRYVVIGKDRTFPSLKEFQSPFRYPLSSTSPRGTP